MNNNNNLNLEENKNISFKSSKDLNDQEIEKLDKCVAKIVRKRSQKNKSTYYTLKFAIYKDKKSTDRLVVAKNIDEVLALIIAKRLGKDFTKDDEFVFNCPIRYSKGSRKDTEGEYYAYDLFLCKGKRLFDFFTENEMDYLNDYNFKLPFENRVYFDEDGYKYESLDF